MRTNAAVKAERDHFTLRGAFRSHDLDMDAVEKLRGELLEKGYVKRAYIAIKAVEHSGQFPLYVLLVKVRGLSSSKKTRELAESELLPWEYLVLPVSGTWRILEYLFMGLGNSRIV